MIATYTIVLALLISTWTDLKTREVPDWISYATMGAGVGLAAITAVFSASWTPIIASVAGLLAGIAVGFAMYYAGQWGGGDAKLIMGLGALMGLDFFAGKYPFGVFLLNTILAGAAYGLVWMIVMVVRKSKAVGKNMKKQIKKYTKIRYVSYMLTVAFVLGAVLIDDLPLRLSLLILALASLGIVYIWALSKAVEEVCMVKDVPVAKLTEGDWIVNDVIVKGKRITGPKDLGVSREQIAKLKKLKVKKVTIKEGIPFVPSFLLAYSALLMWGNWITGLFFFL